jgi:hypothetical protein
MWFFIEQLCTKGQIKLSIAAITDKYLTLHDIAMTASRHTSCLIVHITFNWTVRDTFFSIMLCREALRHFFYVYLETTTVFKETEYQASSYIANLYRDYIGR